MYEGITTLTLGMASKVSHRKVEVPYRDLGLSDLRDAVAWEADRISAAAAYATRPLDAGILRSQQKDVPGRIQHAFYARRAGGDQRSHHNVGFSR